MPKYTHEQFLKLVKEKRGDEYDYSLVQYAGNQAPVTIVCRKHGPFEQKPVYHMSGFGCEKCAREARSAAVRSSMGEVVERCRKVHSSRYAYPDGQEYKNDKSSLRAVCPVHGEFSMPVGDHLYRARGCQKCSRETQTANSRMTTAQFVEKARRVHGDKFDYSATEYSHNHADVTIRCPAHGEFTQLPYNHLQGMGCRGCASGASKGEVELYEFVRSLDASAVFRDRTALAPYELDVWVSGRRVAVEYHGLYWHSEPVVGKTAHLEKLNLCRSRDIVLIQVFEDEWSLKRKIVESALRQRLGLQGERIGARSCSLDPEVPYAEASDFLETNHLQGADSRASAHGLRDRAGTLVALMTFARPSASGSSKSVPWHLSRFVVRAGMAVPGAFTRLLAEHDRRHPGEALATYADLRWSEGAVYSSNGFARTHDTRPNYWYFYRSDPVRRYHRYGFRKQALAKRPGFVYDPDKTEWENMWAAGWSRVWDAGNAAFLRPGARQP